MTGWQLSLAKLQASRCVHWQWLQFHFCLCIYDRGLGGAATQTAGNYCGDCFQRNYVQIVLPLAGRSCSTDRHAHRPQNIRWLWRRHTDSLPSPFMALCKTSASALELKFALGFTVPLLACESKEQTEREQDFWLWQLSVPEHVYYLLQKTDQWSHTKKCRLGLLFFQLSLPTLTTRSAQTRTHLSSDNLDKHYLLKSEFACCKYQLT